MGFIFGLMLATLNLILLGCLFFYFLRNVNAFRKEKKDTDDRVKKEIRVNYLVHRFEKGHERWQFCVRGDTNATTQARSAALCRLSACDSSTAHHALTRLARACACPDATQIWLRTAFLFFVTFIVDIFHYNYPGQEHVIASIVCASVAILILLVFWLLLGGLPCLRKKTWKPYVYPFQIALEQFLLACTMIFLLMAILYNPAVIPTGKCLPSEFSPPAAPPSPPHRPPPSPPRATSATGAKASTARSFAATSTARSLATTGPCNPAIAPPTATKPIATSSAGPTTAATSPEPSAHGKSSAGAVSTPAALTTLPTHTSHQFASPPPVVVVSDCSYGISPNVAIRASLEVVMAVVFIVMLVGSFLIFVIDYLLLSKRLRDNRELYRRIREGIDGPVEGLLLDSHIKLLKADWVLSERKSNDHLASVTRATVEWDVKQAPNDFTPDVKRDVITKVARHLGLSSLCVTFQRGPREQIQRRSREGRGKRETTRLCTRGRRDPWR